MPDGNRSKKQACPIKVRTAFEFDPRKHPGPAFKRHDRFAPQGYSVLFQLTRGIRTDLGPVAASDDIRHPVLHHDRQDPLPYPPCRMQQRVCPHIRNRRSTDSDGLKHRKEPRFQLSRGVRPRCPLREELEARPVVPSAQMTSNPSSAASISLTRVRRNETDL